MSACPASPQQHEGQEGQAEGEPVPHAAAAARAAAAMREQMASLMPPEQLESLTEVEALMRQLRSAGSLGDDPEVEEGMQTLALCASLVRQMHAAAEGMVQEVEDCLGPAQEHAPQRGAEYFEARLRRATAVPPAERSPEVAAFVESAQLCREICELLPLAPSGRPSRSRFEARVEEVVTLALAKYCWCLFISPGASPAGHTDPTPALLPYLKHRVSQTDLDVLQAIGFTSSSPVSASSSSSPAAGKDSGGGAGGSGSGCGPHGVSIGSALRQVLQFSSIAASNNIVGLYRVRVACAALDILSHPGCQEAVDRQLAELAAGQPAHHQPLLLTASQLRYVCCVSLGYLRFDPAKARPDSTTSTRDWPILRMTEAEVEAEIKQAIVRGREGMLQLQPENPCSHLGSGEGEAFTAAAIHHCMEGHHLACLQRSAYWEVRASTHAVLQLFGFINDAASHELDSNSHVASSSRSARSKVARALMRDKPSGAGAGAARRQQRREQHEREQAAAAHPGVPATLLAQALEAYTRAGLALKACKRVLPEQWNVEISAPREAVQKLVPALEAHLDHAQLSGGCIGAGFASQRVRSLGHAMSTAGLGSGRGPELSAIAAGFEAEMRSLDGCLQMGVHLKQLEKSAPGGLLMCTGCGSQAVGLRKCAVCRKAQYCSCECQKAHWRKHRQECQALASRDGNTDS